MYRKFTTGRHSKNYIGNRPKKYKTYYVKDDKQQQQKGKEIEKKRERNRKKNVIVIRQKETNRTKGKLKKTEQK